MGSLKRHSRKLSVSNPAALAAELPEHLRIADPRNWPTLDDHRRAVADYLRKVGVSADLSAQLAPDVSAATGVAFCIVLRDRLTKGKP